MKPTIRNGSAAVAADPQDQALDKRIDMLITQQPALRDMGEFYRATLPLMRTAQKAVAPFALSPKVVRQKLQTGTPLLVGEPLPLDEAQLRTLFLRLCRVVEELADGAAGGRGRNGEKEPMRRTLLSFFKRGEPDAVKLLDRVQNHDETSLRTAAAQQIWQAVDQGQLDLGEVWIALLAGDDAYLYGIAGNTRLDGALLRTLGQHTLRPALCRWHADVKSVVEFDNAWSSGLWRQLGCPLCGSAPHLSEIQGKEGARRLRCGACGLGWGYPRLTCAFCGNQDYHKLGYLSIEGEEEQYRLQTCDLCRHYLKVIVTFDPIAVDYLPLTDLATLHLDAIAVQQGFQGATRLK